MLRTKQVRAGTKEENSLRNTISLYSKMVASQDVLEKASIPPSSIRSGKLSSAGKLSFKVTIVKRSTFEKHLKINQDIPRMKSLHQTDRRQVLVYFSEASLPQYQWIKKENLIKFHTSLLQVRLDKPNPTQTKPPAVTVGCRVEYQDATTGMSKLGVVCVLEGEIAHIADASTLPRVIPWYVFPSL
jgi:hypothetical protein